MAAKRRLAEKPANDSGPINLAALDDMLDGIDENIPAYRAGDRVEFVHAGGKFKGSVIKVLEEGKLKVADKGATVYTITTDDICKEGETAAELIARNKKTGGKRPVYVSTAEIGLKDTPVEDDGDLMGDIEVEPKKKPVTLTKTGKVAKPEPVKKAAPVKKATGGKTQRELVEDLANKGETDYDKIAAKTGVTRVNVGQYMYRWKKAKEATKKKK